MARLLALFLLALAPSAHAQPLHLTADSYTAQEAPATNYGKATVLSVRNNAPGLTRQAYLRFDLSTVPYPSVAQADLVLWVSKVLDDGTLELVLCTSAWSEAAVPAPACAGPAFASAALTNVAHSSTFVTLDLTAQVNAWLAAPATNHGLLLRGAAGDPLRADLDSKEGTGTSHPAEIVLWP